MKATEDISQFSIFINNVCIHIASDNHSPLPIKAMVEEQDTSLVLEPENIIRDPGVEKPAWYMASILEYQKLHKPGEIIFKPGNPIRLWAIIHDLELTPSWRSEWIEKALKNILELCEKKNIVSVCLPVLGSQFGHFKLTKFIPLLVKALKNSNPSALKNIWLVVPPDEECHTVFTMLKKLSTIESF